MTIDDQIDATALQVAAMAKRCVRSNPKFFGRVTLSIDLLAGQVSLGAAEATTDSGDALVETCKAPKQHPPAKR